MRTRLTRRGRVVLRVVASAMVAAAAVLTATLGEREEPAVAAPPDERRATTPLLSARRLPHLFTDELARRRLQESLDAFAARLGGDLCITVDDAPGDGVLARVGPATAHAPASAIKLLTGAAALETLGPAHRFTTRVALVGRTLHLVGGADPVLTTPAYEARLRADPVTQTAPVTPLARLADDTAAALRERGVTAVDAVVGDGTRHTDADFLPGWRESYRDDVGPLGALAVDDGTEPAGRAADAAASAAAQFAALLAARGVAVGTVAAGPAPADAPDVATIESPPLDELVAAMLTSSDNYTAEILLREVGRAREGAATTAAGAAATAAVLRAAGVPTDGLAMLDGSGLHPGNRATCETLLAVLQLRGPGLDALDAGLAVAGRSGTLRTRVAPDDPLAGVLRAKTGQIRGVVALAGVVDDAEHLRFAFEHGGAFTTAEGHAHQLELARTVAAYPEAPAASDLVPAP